MRWRVAAIVLGMLVLFGLSLFLDAGAMREAVDYLRKNPFGLLAAFAAYTVAFGLRALSWRPLAGEYPRRRLLSLLLAALFLNHAAPAKAGDFARIYGLARLGGGAGRAAASVILARLADLTGLLMVLAAAWTFAGGAVWSAVAAPAAMVLVAALAITSLTRLRVPRWPGLCRIPDLLEKVGSALRETNLRSFAVALTWAVPAWVFEAGILYYAALGVGLDISFAGAVAATCIAVLFSAVPITPGSVGTYEVGAVLALVAAGAPPESAFAAAVLSHAMKFLYSFAVAPLAFYEGLAMVTRRDVKVPNKREVEDEAGVEV